MEWVALMLMLAPFYVGLIVGGGAAMRFGRERDRPGLRAIGLGAFWAGVMILMLGVFAFLFVR